MHGEESPDANSELFKEGYDEAMEKNSCKIRLCDSISVSLALRSVSHRYRQENDALVLRISAFTHPSFSGLQGRFLASLEMTIREPHVSQPPVTASPIVPKLTR